MENNFEKNNEEIVDKNGAEALENATDNASSESSSTVNESKDKKKFPIWIIPVAIAVVIGIAMAIILPGLFGGDETTDPTYCDYSVSVVDYLGNPMSNVMVIFTAPDGEESMIITENNGIALLENVIAGEYKVVVDKGFSNATIFTNEYTLTEEKNELCVVARDGDNSIDISGDVDAGSYAHNISVDDFSVYTEAGKTTYLSFDPIEAGIYGITITNASRSSLSYYGIYNEVKLINLGDYDKETKTLSVVLSYTDFTYIIGVDSDATEWVDISVTRISDVPYYIYGAVEDGTTAEPVGTGTHTFEGEAGKTSYAVFTPGRTGIYKISFNSDDEGMTIGYYGLPMVVQPNHCGDGEYDGKTFEFVVHDGDTPRVIGINFTKTTSAELIIERTGDAPFDPQYAPWTEVPAPTDIDKCHLPKETILTDLDVTDPTLSVTRGDDGYYYTSDGKLVYIRIGSVGQNGYLDVSIAYIAGLVDQNFGSNFGGYVYDENGEFVDKYSYNSLLKAYYEKCSGSGVYPLTDDLAEAIQLHGNNCGWWRYGTVNYLFNGVGVVVENAWLFLCCTAN